MFAIWALANGLISSPAIGIAGALTLALSILWFQCLFIYVNTCDDKRDYGLTETNKLLFRLKKVELTGLTFCLIACMGTVGSVTSAFISGYMCFALLEPGIALYYQTQGLVAPHTLLLTLTYLYAAIYSIYTFNLCLRCSTKYYWRLQLEPITSEQPGLTAAPGLLALGTQGHRAPSPTLAAKIAQDSKGMPVPDTAHLAGALPNPSDPPSGRPSQGAN